MEAEDPACSTPRGAAGGALGAAAEAHFMIKSCNALHSDVSFECIRSTKVGRFFDGYACHMGVDKQKVVMVFEGKRIREGSDATMGELGMVDGDVVDVFMSQARD
jgi:hypothetical protein